MIENRLILRLYKYKCVTVGTRCLREQALLEDTNSFGEIMSRIRYIILVKAFFFCTFMLLIN